MSVSCRVSRAELGSAAQNQSPPLSHCIYGSPRASLSGSSSSRHPLAPSFGCLMETVPACWQPGDRQLPLEQPAPSCPCLPRGAEQWLPKIHTAFLLAWQQKSPSVLASAFGSQANLNVGDVIKFPTFSISII